MPQTAKGRAGQRDVMLVASRSRQERMSSLETLAGLLMASLTPTILYGTAPCTMPLSFSFHFFFSSPYKANIKGRSKAAPRSNI